MSCMSIKLVKLHYMSCECMHITLYYIIMSCKCMSIELHYIIMPHDIMSVNIYITTPVS